MSRVITWTASPKEGNPLMYQNTGLFYGENIVRYMEFKPTWSARLCLRGTMPITLNGREYLLRLV